MSAALQAIKANLGKEVPPSSWLLIDQQRIDDFAAVTNDHAFIHVDPERASQTMLGGTIAHGLLTLSLLPAMAYEVLPDSGLFKMGVNYGYDKVRFLNPVRCGKRIRARFKLLDFTEIRPGEWRQLMEGIVEIEGETKPALVVEWITLLYV